MPNNHYYQDTSRFATNASSSNDDTARVGKRKRDDDEYESMDEARQAVLRCLMDLQEDDPPREANPAPAAIGRSGSIAPAIIYDSETRYQRAAAAATDLPRLVPCHKKRKTKPARDCRQEDNIGVIDLTATDTEDEEEQDDGNQGKTNATMQKNEDDDDDDLDDGMEEESDEKEEDYDDDDLDDCVNEKTNDKAESLEDSPNSIEREAMPVIETHEQKLNRLWEEKFQLLVAYKEKHKTTKVPISNPVLGRWVHTQRQNYRKKELSVYRIRQLNSIGFKWKIYPAWMDMYNRLVQYYNDHGTAIVPTKNDPELHIWVNNQRHHCKDPERILLLNKIGFKWEIRQCNRVSWMDMYHRLVTYYNDHGTTIVSKQDDLKLYGWANYQRQKCKDPQRISLLNQIGFQCSHKRKDDPTILAQKTAVVQDTILL